MTVSNEYQIVRIAGNGATTTWPFPYPIFDPGDLSVALYDSSNAAVVVTLNGNGTYDYTVTGTQDADTGEYASGVSVIFNTRPPSGYTGYILPDAAALQPLQLSNGGPLSLAALMAECDRLTLLIQQGRLVQNFSLITPISDPRPPSAIPSAVARANGFLGFDANGDPFVTDLAGSNVGANPSNVASIAALKAAPPINQSFVTVSGYYGLNTALDSYGGGFFYLVSGDTTSTDDGFTVLVDVNGKRWYRMFLGAKINVHMAGAKGDNSATDSTAIQKCIDYVSARGGGKVWHPGLGATYICNVTLKQGVVLSCDAHFPGYTYTGGLSPTVYKSASTTAWVIDTPAGQTDLCGVEGISCIPAAGQTAGGGIRLQNSNRPIIENVSACGFPDQGILHLAGIAGRFYNLFTIGNLTNQTRTGYVGSMELWSTDHYIKGIETGVGISTVSAGGWLCGLLLKAGGCFGEDIECEASDVGLCFSSANSGNGGTNRLTNIRCDINAGIGMLFDGAGGNRITNVSFSNNSKSSSGTYPALKAQGSSQDNKVLNIQCVQPDSSHLVSYVIDDQTTYGAAEARSVYGPISFLRQDGGLPPYSIAAVRFDSTNHQGSGLIESPVLVQSNSTTPDTTGTDRISLAVAGSVTNFLGGYDGKIIHVYSASGTNTLVNGATIKTSTGSNKTLTNGLFYDLMYYAGVWGERG